MSEERPTLAVFGGSFDPPHLGHVMVPALVLSLTRASEVLIVPSYQHPFEKKLTAFDHRVALCKLAFGAYTDQVKVSTIE